MDTAAVVVVLVSSQLSPEHCKHFLRFTGSTTVLHPPDAVTKQIEHVELSIQSLTSRYDDTQLRLISFADLKIMKKKIYI